MYNPIARSGSKRHRSALAAIAAVLMACIAVVWAPAASAQPVLVHTDSCSGVGSCQLTVDTTGYSKVHVVILVGSDGNAAAPTTVQVRPDDPEQPALTAAASSSYQGSDPNIGYEGVFDAGFMTTGGKTVYDISQVSNGYGSVWAEALEANGQQNMALEGVGAASTSVAHPTITVPVTNANDLVFCGVFDSSQALTITSAATGNTIQTQWQNTTDSTTQAVYQVTSPVVGNNVCGEGTPSERYDDMNLVSFAFQGV